MGNVLFQLGIGVLAIMLVISGVNKFLVKDPTTWQVVHGCLRITFGTLFLGQAAFALVRAKKATDMPEAEASGDKPQ